MFKFKIKGTETIICKEEETDVTLCFLYIFLKVISPIYIHHFRPIYSQLVCTQSWGFNWLSLHFFSSNLFSGATGPNSSLFCWKCWVDWRNHNKSNCTNTYWTSEYCDHPSLPVSTLFPCVSVVTEAPHPMMANRKVSGSHKSVCLNLETNSGSYLVAEGMWLLLCWIWQ